MADRQEREAQSTARGGPHKKLRFTFQEDLWLLREVLGSNPYEDSARWTLITDALNRVSGQTFTSRAVRERTERLLSLFRQQDTASLRKSETEEQYEEKEILLQDIVDLVRSFPPAKKKQVSGKATANQQRDNAMQALAASQSSRCSQDGRDPWRNAHTAVPPAALACPETSGSREADQGTEAVLPSSCTSRPYIMRSGCKRKTLWAAVNVLASRTNRGIRQLALDERKLKLEEEKQKLERERFESVELFVYSLSLSSASNGLMNIEWLCIVS
ncbi:unnamed protein product [Ixodes hexagonus]